MLRKIAILGFAVLLLGFTPQNTTVSSGWITICDANVSNYSNLTFHVKNTGVTNPLTACRVQAFVGPPSADWKDVTTTWAECNSLATSAYTYWSVSGSSFSKLRVQAQSTLGTTTYCRPFGTK